MVKAFSEEALTELCPSTLSFHRRWLVESETSDMRSPKRPIHHPQLVLLSRAGGKCAGFHQPRHFVLCTAQMPPQDLSVK